MSNSNARNRESKTQKQLRCARSETCVLSIKDEKPCFTGKCQRFKPLKKGKKKKWRH